MNRFEGKSVLVTGATSGLGLAAAKAFSVEGARVVLTGRNAAALEAARTACGTAAIAVRNDVADPGAPADLARTLGEVPLRLDAAFLNAGITRFSAFAETSRELWDAMFDTNVKGAYFQIQALLPLFNPGAAIVLNGSINAHIGAPGSSV